MQTICPHCQTVFKVSDEHLKAADGYVRCGICKEIFNALIKETAAVKKSPPANRTTAPAADAGVGKTTVPAPERPDSVKSTPPQNTGQPVATKPAVRPLAGSTASAPLAASPTAETTDSVNSVQTDMFAVAAKTENPEALAPAAKIAPTAIKSAMPDAGAATAEIKIETGTGVLEKSRRAGATPDKRPDDHPEPTAGANVEAASAIASAPASTKQSPSNIIKDAHHEAEDTDLFDGVQSKLIPDEYRIPELHNTYSLWRDIAWSLAILVFTATLFAEYIWFNRNELISDPQLRPLVTQFCALANCDTMDLREPAKIEMTTRNIYSHPNVKNALMISGTLVNHAHFEQPYPNIQIDFSDVRGEVIASRIFTPEHYMQIKLSSLKLMPPEMPVDFNMEIQDPGNDAMTYEFSFL